MVTWNEPPPPELPQRALEDCFKPPDTPVRVRCLHCGQEYDSDSIVWREECGGMWCCPVPGCGGAGFGFDILPADADIWSDDPEDADDPDDVEDLDDPDDLDAPPAPDDDIPW